MSAGVDPRVSRTIVALVSGAAVTAATARLVTRAAVGHERTWTRTNHAGRRVTLLEGPAWVCGAAAASLGLADPVTAAAVSATGAVGLLDDLAGDGSAKGLRGHLSALRNGAVTTGVVKVVGLGLAGLGVALAARRDRGRGAVTVVDLVVDTTLVAGLGNLVNLLDLRPGRALKATVLLGLPLAALGSQPAAIAVGASLAALPDDLAGRSMLGDAGANAAGVMLGRAATQTVGRAGRIGLLAAVVALTLVSERVSFTAVIERTPWLRALDHWGRTDG